MNRRPSSCSSSFSCRRRRRSPPPASVSSSTAAAAPPRSAPSSPAPTILRRCATTRPAWRGSKASSSQAGLDFGAPKDELDTPGRTDLPHHIIQFPPALYATWKPEELALPLTFALGLDSPLWTIENWDTALFPGRFETIRQEATFFELRPTVGWAIDERWSLGVSLRYVTGAFETSFASRQGLILGPQNVVVAEITGEAATQVDGLGVDLGVQYAADNWGWGAVLGSGVSLDGGGDSSYYPREPFTDPQVQAAFDRRFASSATQMNFELPPTAAIGLWWGVTDSLKLEGDVVWSGWSALDRTRIEITNNPYRLYGSGEPERLIATATGRMSSACVSAPSGRSRLSGRWAAASPSNPARCPTRRSSPASRRGTRSSSPSALPAIWRGSPSTPATRTTSTPTPTSGSTVHGQPVDGTFSGRAQVFSISARWRR